jgi:hypothetical protein
MDHPLEDSRAQHTLHPAVTVHQDARAVPFDAMLLAIEPVTSVGEPLAPGMIGVERSLGPGCMVEEHLFDLFQIHRGPPPLRNLDQPCG